MMAAVSGGSDNPVLPETNEVSSGGSAVVVLVVMLVRLFG